MRLPRIGSLVLLLACTLLATAAKQSAPRDLLREAAAHYEAYGSALRDHRRDLLAGFYSPDTTLFVINGAERAVSRKNLDRSYRQTWQGPEHFSWDRLRYELLDQRNVIVTGYFNWQRPAATDTTRFQYLAILQRADSGLVIRVEHETELPRRP